MDDFAFRIANQEIIGWQVHIALDPATKSFKGLAFVKYVKPECAIAAYEALDKVSFQGRLLHILPAVDRNGSERATDLSGKPKTVKAAKEKKRKDMAGREFNWSMLYMNVCYAICSVLIHSDFCSFPE